jgi:hypothetical protein
VTKPRAERDRALAPTDDDDIRLRLVAELNGLAPAILEPRRAVGGRSVHDALGPPRAEALLVSFQLLERRERFEETNCRLMEGLDARGSINAQPHPVAGPRPRAGARTRHTPRTQRQSAVGGCCTSVTDAGITVHRYSERPELWAMGRSMPYPWDGTDEGLGPGIDHALGAALEAADAGFTHLIAPVRPNQKERYPIAPIERYITWTNAKGEPFDPWIRVHTRRGAVIVRAIPRSMFITGTVAEWEQWTGMSFPDDGAYTFPAGLATVEIDRGRDRGDYWEPNVWIVHTLS